MAFIKKNWLALSALLVGVVALVWLGYNSSGKSNIQAQINNIDNQIAGGRLSASDTVALYARKKALLQQLKKFI